MATKEPWNNEIYRAMREDEPTEKRRKNKAQEEELKRPLTTRFLTFLVVLMFILVGLALGFILWNSQIQNNKTINASFHQVSSAPAKTATSSTPASSSQAPSSADSTGTSTSSAAPAGSTYTIVTGDYPSTIASKTGLSWDKIASLNNISADGYNADGSAIHAGQVLKLK